MLAFGAADAASRAPSLASLAGLALFAALLVATRSLGLRDAWAYLRALD